MMFMRGHPTNYEAWAQTGVKGWSFDDLLPYFKRSETAHGHDPALRGTDGPLTVAPADPLMSYRPHVCRPPSNRVAPPTSAAAPRPASGRWIVNVVSGQRHTAADAYLWQALPRPNVDSSRMQWFTACFSRATGASGFECRVVDEERTVLVRAGEVILSAGAV
jgi:choline dehydrogenase-like flavoprotein